MANNGPIGNDVDINSYGGHKPSQNQGDDDSNFQVHPEFKNAGQSPGLEIWRIEQFEPVKQDQSTFGKFYTGDCYLVLNTKVKQGSNKYEYDLHFWLGEESTQDEYGSVAMRTVELDESVLGGAAVQYREVQAHETKLFLSYFKNQIKYLTGGTKSGFTHVDRDAFEKRLFQLKGKKNIRIAQVPCMCGSLNQGDTFVLDDGRNIYVWIGPGSTKKEKMSGAMYAKYLRDNERGGKAHIHIVQDWRSDAAFFKALGSHDKVIKAADDHDDEDIIRKLDQSILLYKVTDQHMKDIAARPLKNTMLTSDACFILDSGPTGIFLWTGRKCSNKMKRSIWGRVQKFMDSRGYPLYLPVVRVVDGGETPLFRQYFEWERQESNEEREPQNKTAGQDYSGAKGVDMNDLHDRPPKTEEWMPDDGRGELKVWRLENRELAPVPEKAYGVFFGGDSYVVLYKYVNNNKDAYIIYFWQGTKSSVDEKAAAALQTVAIDDKFGGAAVQVRVVQNKEPAHFIKAFGGKLVYFMGGHVSGFRSLKDYEDFDPKQVHMFQIKGSPDAMRAVQVQARAASLNANDIFIVDSERKTFAWVGQYASDLEGTAAKSMLAHISPEKGEPIIVEEGKESPTFWNILGGEEAYYKGRKKQTADHQMPPRLFHCSMSSGKFTVEEIVRYTQEDLNEDDVMLLDTFDELFVWIGQGAKEFEKKESYKTAYTYLSVDPSGRNSENTLIIVVKQGFEPPSFSGCFPVWDIEQWNKGLTFEEIMAEIGNENAGINLLADEMEKYTSFYEYDELKRRVPPEGVDVQNKEYYLNPEEFQKVFGLDKDRYKNLPEWKRVQLKKQLSLF